MSSDLYGVHSGGPDLSYVESRLHRLFKQQGVMPGPADFGTDAKPVPVRPIVLVFGRPSSKVFQEEFLHERAYYHLRSGDNVELFYMGYTNSSQLPDPSEPSFFDENGFSDTYFVSALEDIERRTTWKYTGGTDLILLNSCWAPPRHERVVYIPEVRLDFSATLVLNLERALNAKLIPSGRFLIETIMRRSREYPAQDVVLTVSDEIVLKSAGRSLFEWIASVFKLKVDDLTNVLRGIVTDISKKPA